MDFAQMGGAFIIAFFLLVIFSFLSFITLIGIQRLLNDLKDELKRISRAEPASVAAPFVEPLP